MSSSNDVLAPNLLIQKSGNLRQGFGNDPRNLADFGNGAGNHPITDQTSYEDNSQNDHCIGEPVADYSRSVPVYPVCAGMQNDGQQAPGKCQEDNIEPVPKA